MHPADTPRPRGLLPRLQRTVSQLTDSPPRVPRALPTSTPGHFHVSERHTQMSANPLLVSRRRALLLAGGTALSTATLTLLPAATASAAASHGDDDQSTALVLAWYDLTTQTIAAAAFPEPVTASRVW